MSETQLHGATPRERPPDLEALAVIASFVKGLRGERDRLIRESTQPLRAIAEATSLSVEGVRRIRKKEQT